MKPFPFNLTGPDFLLCYALFSAAVLIIARAARSTRELAVGGESPRVVDPCEIACLRAGRDEAIFVALMSLEAQGLVSRETPSKLRVASGTAAGGRSSLERAAFDYVRRGGGAAPKGIYRDAAVTDAADAVRHELVERGLIRDPWTIAGNVGLVPTLVALVVLWTVALVRIWSSGPPVGFLCVMLGMVTFAGVVALANPRTASGDAALRRLRLSFNVARRRVSAAPSGSVLSDAVLVTAVFGLAALPKFLRGQYPWWQPARDSGGGCGSGSCGSGGGSGCGGGGCGGGCGG